MSLYAIMKHLTHQAWVSLRPGQAWRRSKYWRRARNACLKRHKHRCWVTNKWYLVLHVHHTVSAEAHPEHRFTVRFLLPMRPDIHTDMHRDHGGTHVEITPKQCFAWIKKNRHKYL